jgi:DNA-binding MarR family transcriptional regulator
MATERALDDTRKNWPETVRDDSDVVVLAQRLAALAQGNARRALAPLGLGFTEFEMLCALRSQPPPHQMLPSALYDALLISSGGLTKVLKGLQARGLVARPGSGGDRRRRPVALTAEGRALVERAVVAVQGADRDRLRGAGLGAADYAVLRRGLLNLVRAMEGPGQDEAASRRSR